MDEVTVKDLASEFGLKQTVILAELKKIGVWVPSVSTPVDTDIANRIRKRLQVLVQSEDEGKEKKAAKPGKSPVSRTRKSIKQLGRPRKRTAEPAEPAAKTSEEPLLTAEPSLRPRKGRRSFYEKTEIAPPEKVEKPREVTIEDEPVIEVVEARAPTTLPETPQAVEELEPQVTEEQPVEEPWAPTPEEEEPEAVVAVETPGEEVTAGLRVEVEGEVEAEAATAEETLVEVPPAVEAVEEQKTETVQQAASAVEAIKPQRVKKAVVKKRKEKKARLLEAAREVAAEEKKIPAEQGPREVYFPEKITVKSFAEATGVKTSDLIRALMSMGIMATVNQLLDPQTVEKLCGQFDIIPHFTTFEEVTARAEQEEEAPEDLEPRAPVVTIMGHVDHGKTTLLDFIRKTKVAESEAGGITQHIGAYQVETKGKRIVFIDTPGHEAFTRMRARGAQVTDIVVLVVAADDGVMPQTLEAIDHARAAGVPILVAVNKIDKPGAQPDRVKQQLSDRGLIPEDWGGDTIMVEVSAKTGANIDLLLEMILLMAEMLELKANPRRAASGVVLEARLDRGRGAVATLLVQNGTLHVGDNFIAGSSWGRIRAMLNDRGEPIQQAGPSSAVEILGLQGVPQAGDAFQVVEDLAAAKEMAEFRLQQLRQEELAETSRLRLDDLYAQLQTGAVKELPIVLKADTQGSVEVLEDALTRLSNDQVRIDVIHKGVGGITESDVLLASASNAVVVGFNVRPDASARAAAEKENVEIRLYSVIYEVAEEIRQAMQGLLAPTTTERVLGRAEVRETFRVPRVGTVAGCYVTEGMLTRNSLVRLLRDNVVVYEGRVGSLKRFKDDVSEVRSGYECGLSIANFNDIKVGDVIEAFAREEVAAQLA
jgi:translation initiation factor IF-2